MKNQTIKTVALSILASSFLLAAPPSAGDIEKQIVIPKAVQEKEGVNNVIPEFVPKAQTQESVKEKPVVPQTKYLLEKDISPTIKGFGFVGNDSISDEALFEVLKEYVGKELNPQIIFEAQNILTHFYQSKGFPKARTYAFVENIKEGVLTFEVRARNEAGHAVLSSRKGYIKPNRDTQAFLKELGYVKEVKETVDFQKVPTVHITKITYEGNEHMAKESLDELLKSHLGKAYTFEELKKMTSIVTKYYREQGYFVARAYLSQNAIEGETFKISIIEGAYGEFKLSNTSLVNDEQIKEMLEEVAQDKIISVSTLERAMLLINDTPGAKVTKADIMPGRFVGSSDFAITTESTNPYSAYILGDNYGSKYTGKYRVNLGLSANSPLGYGDKLSFNGLLSTTGDLKNGRIAYGFPLMSNGLRGELSASRTTYSLDELYTGMEGLSTSLEGSLIYPLIRTKTENLNLSLAYAHKKLEENDDAAKYAKAVTVGANYTSNSVLFGMESITNASLNLTRGSLDISDATAYALDQAGVKTNGEYTKVTGSLEKALQLNAKTSLTTSLRFQKALGNKNLDGSEDFSLGEAYGVRAFPDGEHSAENGYILGLELFYALPSYEGINHKASIFADTGYAKMENPLLGSEARHLSDIGLGYQASYKDFFAKAQIARVIGGEKSETEDKDSTRLLLQLGWIY